MISLISNLNRNQTKEESIFNGIVAWCRHDEPREKEFPALFEKLIDFNKMSINMLKELALKEELVAKSNYCLRLVTSYVFQRCKSCDAAKIVFSLGGTKSPCSCVKVLNTSNCPQKELPDLPIELDAHCSLSSKNFVYLIGGSNIKEDVETTVQTVWQINIKDPILKWKEVAPLNIKRQLMGGTVFRDTLVVAGGHNEDFEIMNSIEYYQAALNEWKFVSSLQNPRSGCTLVATDQHLFALGGFVDGKSSASVERVKNLNEKWIEIQSMQTPRNEFAAVICDEAIYGIGGQTNLDKDERTNTVEKYNLAEEKWQYVNNMSTSRVAHAACVVNKKIYVVGGLNQLNEAVKSIECYDRTTDQWSVVGETDDALYHHSLIVL